MSWFQECEQPGPASVMASQGVTVSISGENYVQNGFAPSDGRSPLGDMRGLEGIYRYAAGYEGNPIYQYVLGEIFSHDDSKANPTAAYFWYYLARYNPQTLTDEKIRDIIDGNFPDLRNRTGTEERKRALLIFEEVYLRGGPKAYFHLGRLYQERQIGADSIGYTSESTGYSQNPDEQDIYAYAWLTLAMKFDYLQAEEYLKQITLSDLNRKLAVLLAAEYYERVARMGQGGSPSGPLPPSVPWPYWGGNQGNYGGNDYALTLPGARGPGGQVGAALERGDWFQTRRNPIDPENNARTWLQVGRAYLSAGEIAQAKTAFNTAILIDSSSPAALDAQRHLQSMTTTCAYVSRYDKVKLSDGSYVESRNPDANLNYKLDPVFGFEPDLTSIGQVELKVSQRALRALGHYNGEVDGISGPGTRRAIRDFQRRLNVNETGRLSAMETVKLLCNAAQTAEHADSQNILGILYLSGIGLKQDFDLGHYWLSRAAEKNNPSALFNLGLLYRKGVEGQSLPLSENGRPMVNPKTGQLIRYFPNGKGMPRDLQLARQYFNEAAEYGHPHARKMLAKVVSEIKRPRRKKSDIVDKEAESRAKKKN